MFELYKTYCFQRGIIKFNVAGATDHDKFRLNKHVLYVNGCSLNLSQPLNNVQLLNSKW